MVYERKIVVYDRERSSEQRLSANRQLLSLYGNGLLFEPVSRLKEFLNQPGASDLLLADSFAFAGVVVHLQGMDASKVLEDALLGREIRGDFFPVVGITAMTLPDPGDVHYVHTRAGNGYLSAPEAQIVTQFFQEGRNPSQKSTSPALFTDLVARL